MAKYKISLTVKAAQPASVEKKLRDAFGADLPIHTVEKITTLESRSARLTDALSDFECSRDDCKSIVEELKDEMQNWLDSIPENLQSGGKAEEVQEAIDALDSLEDELDNVEIPAVDVNFPSMF